MPSPDHEFSHKEGETTRLTLGARPRPWHVRIGGHDLFVVVECEDGEQPVPPEDEEPKVGVERISPELEDFDIVKPEGRRIG